MSKQKDPTAQGASARRAVEEGKWWKTPGQLPLPLHPMPMRMAGLKAVRRLGDGVPTAVERAREPEKHSSREEKPVRRKRVRSPISVTTIKRVIGAVKAGPPVGVFEVWSDGTIVVRSGHANADVTDVFDTWASRL